MAASKNLKCSIKTTERERRVEDKRGTKNKDNKRKTMMC